MQLTLTQERMIEAAEVFLWADTTDYTAWFRGHWGRSKMAEYNLPRMVKKGVLVEAKFGKQKVYRLKGKRGVNSTNIRHGLICTKSLLRFMMSEEGEIISESFLRTLQLEAIPEWGIRYKASTLCFEFSTADNFRRRSLMTNKLRKYRRTMQTLEQYFSAKPVVLFVYDAPRAQVEAFVKSKTRPDDWAFYFSDLQSFADVPIGEHLTAPIYMWANGDGVALRHA